MGRSVGMCGESGLRTPVPVPPSPAYLPDEAITLRGRWCLVWRGSKGHCDRGLSPTPGPVPKATRLSGASGLHLPLLAVSCSVLTYLPPSPSLPSLSFSVPLSSALSPCVYFCGSQFPGSLPSTLGSLWTTVPPSLSCCFQRSALAPFLVLKQ